MLDDPYGPFEPPPAEGGMLPGGIGPGRQPEDMAEGPADRAADRLREDGDLIHNSTPFVDNRGYGSGNGHESGGVPQ